MTTFSTITTAVCPKTGELSDWMGPRIKAKSREDAELFLQEAGFGNYRILGKFIEEIDAIKNYGALNRLN